MSESSLFRRKAVEHAASEVLTSQVLRLSPAWTAWSYWVIVAAFAAALAYALVFRVNEYASGPAIVRVGDTLEVSADRPATVASVDVHPGDGVSAGQVLVRLYSEPQRAAVESLERDFEYKLARALRDPTDALLRQSLTALRSEKELAERQLEQLSIRASRAGTIGDIRVRHGQPVAAGDVLLTLSGSGSGCAVWTLLPGYHRPELAAADTLRFEVSGYRYAHETAAIQTVGEQVIGPSEARRFLGNDISDAVPVAGSVVLVQASLPSCSFRADGEALRFHHGMTGRAEVKLQSKPLWRALLPALDERAKAGP